MMEQLDQNCLIRLKGEKCAEIVFEETSCLAWHSEQIHSQRTIALMVTFSDREIISPSCMRQTVTALFENIEGIPSACIFYSGYYGVKVPKYGIVP